MAKQAVFALTLPKAAKQLDEAEDWLSQMKRHAGTGVSYFSAPNGAMTYSAANLSR